MKNIEHKYKRIIFIALLFTFFLFRLPGLGIDVSNTDAYRWHKRSENFLQALKTKDYKSTYQHYQPGVTLMWMNAVVKQVSFSYQFHVQGNKEPLTLEHADYYPVIHGISKAVLVVVLGILLFLQIIFINKIFNFKTAAIYGFFMVTEPYLIGMDRWFHLTSLETYFSFTAFLCVLMWFKFEKIKYVITSALFFVFAVLSKVTPVITIPLYIIIFFVRSKNDYRKFIYVLLIFTIASLFFTFLLFPALVTNFVFVINKIHGAINSAVNTGYSVKQFSPTIRILFYGAILAFKLSPVLFVLMIVSFIKCKVTFGDFPRKSILLYLLFFVIFLTISGKKIDRYVISMIPPIILLCAGYLSNAEWKSIRRVVSLNVFILVLSMFLYYPVYSAYYSPLLGGTPSAIKIGLYDNSGEYFADAAVYLNKKGRETKVYVPHGMASFYYYFKGIVVNDIKEADYVVTSYDLTRKRIDNLQCEEYVNSFGSKELDVVFVFSCKDME